LSETPRNRDWIGCVDFGTTFSKVAMVRAVDRDALEPGDITPIAIGKSDIVQSGNPFLSPSAVFIRQDEDTGLYFMMFGGEAMAHARQMESDGRVPFTSMKYHLTANATATLDQTLPLAIDPSGQVTPRIAITAYLASLLVKADMAVAAAGKPWPVAVRLGRPAWPEGHAEEGEKALQDMVGWAFAFRDAFGLALDAPGGIALDDLMVAWKDRAPAPGGVMSSVFEADGTGKASVLEATAVAAALIDQLDRRRVILIADIGGGTSDFGAFLTGLPGDASIAHIRGGSGALRKAGDHLDALLVRFALIIMPHLEGEAAARAEQLIWPRAREYKEVLFREGQVMILAGDDIVEVSEADFLRMPEVIAFTDDLASMFSKSYKVAAECAALYPDPVTGEPTPVEIVLTGGGHDLPMVRALVGLGAQSWPCVEAPGDALAQAEDPGIKSLYRQLAVAIGGSMKQLPREAPTLKLSKLF
jgi:hypothetical protein